MVGHVRVGFGYDIHRLVSGRKLVLGGVTIPHSAGLLGDSDADVLVHAIIDALLGASACGDIGQHFPPGDDRFKGICSIRMLEKVVGILQDKSITVINIDTVVILEEPRLGPFIDEMCINLTSTIGIPRNQFNIKATTNKGIGAIGSKKAIAAFAVAVISMVAG